MQYYNFQRLIKKYSTNFTASIKSAGHYDEKGDYIDGDTVEKVLSGAIISMSENKIYRSSGLLTSNDKQLFMLQPLDRALLGATIIYKGRNYKVEQETENAEFTGVYSYVLKYVSAFEQGANK